MASKPKDQLSGNNLLIVMVLISFLVVGVSGLVGKALVTNIILHSKVLTAKQAADTNLNKDLDAAPNLVSAFSSLGPQAGKIADALPNDSDFPGLLVLLENMSNDAGVQMKDVTPTVAATVAGTAPAGAAASTDASQAPAPQTFDFQINVTGRYDTVLKMLDHLEKSARPMRITASQLSGSGSSLTGAITVETYFQDKAQLPFSTETIK